MVGKEELYTLKINYKGKRTVGKANKDINVEKIMVYKIVTYVERNLGYLQIVHLLRANLS